MCDFKFLVDVTGCLEELNCCLQSKARVMKLVLWERQLKVNGYSHFPAAAAVNRNETRNSEGYC